MDGAAPDTRLNAQRKAYTAARSDARSTRDLAGKVKGDPVELASFDPFSRSSRGRRGVRRRTPRRRGRRQRPRRSRRRRTRAARARRRGPASAGRLTPVPARGRGSPPAAGVRFSRERRRPPAQAQPRRAAREPRRVLPSRQRDPPRRQHTGDAVPRRRHGRAAPGRAPARRRRCRRPLELRQGSLAAARPHAPRALPDHLRQQGRGGRRAPAVRAAHARVNGTTSAQLGIFPPGTAYSAEDPELMLWVHATLVHSSLCAYQRFERELSRAEQESYYREMAIVAELFGTPAASSQHARRSPRVLRGADRQRARSPSPSPPVQIARAI